MIPGAETSMMTITQFARIAVRIVLCATMLIAIPFSLSVGLTIVADAQTISAGPDSVSTGHIDTSPKHVLNSFDPDSALGSSIDVLSRKDIDYVFSPHIIQESLAAGWGPISYRNNTELRMAAWHWTENGSWSDAAHKSGYFSGSAELKD